MSMITLVIALALFSGGSESRRDAAGRLGKPPLNGRKPAVTALVPTPDGNGFLHGSQAGVLFRPFSGGEEIRLATQLEHVHAFAFSPDGKTLAVAGGTPGESGGVELWTWPDKKLRARFHEHDDVVHDLAWSPNGKTLATASADRTVRLWDAATQKGTATLTGHSGPVLALALSPDGSLLCSGSADQTIRVWDMATGKLLRALTNHLGPVHSLAFRPGKKDEPLTLASAGGDGTVRLWQPAVGRMVRILRHPTPVYAVAWDHAGAHLWSGAKDGWLRRFDPEGGAVVQEKEVSRGWVVSLATCPRTKRVLAGDSLGRVAILGE